MKKKVKVTDSTLINIKHEKFARAVIEFNGDPQACLLAAGYKYSRSYYSQLKARPDISKRIASLIDENNSGKVAKLTERLEILTGMARDIALAKSLRIKALHELHNQSGDARQVIDVNNNNVITYTEIELPKKNAQKEKSDEDLDIFIRNMDTELCLAS